MIGTFDSGVLSSERGNGDENSFVRFVQIFSDRTVTMLKIKAMMACSVNRPSSLCFSQSSF